MELVQLSLLLSYERIIKFMDVGMKENTNYIIVFYCEYGASNI
jgi:hypothetical protein